MYAILLRNAHGGLDWFVDSRGLIVTSKEFLKMEALALRYLYEWRHEYRQALIVWLVDRSITGMVDTNDAEEWQRDLESNVNNYLMENT